MIHVEGLVAYVVVIGACCARILLRRHRQPESRVAWLAVTLALPYVGVVAYLLFGETNIGRKRAARLKQVFAGLPAPGLVAGSDASALSPHDRARFGHLFRLGETISGYAPTGGNRARLTEDSEAAISDLVADIDRAVGSVHLLFYIWLDDGSGRKVAEALKHAAARGVNCRVLVDDVGSRALTRSDLWRSLPAAGVQVARALPVGNPLLRVIGSRIDLRNHRKIVVIDNRVTYCGSQNCADAAFLPKARFAPWVDILARFEGPVVRQNQHLFASDWMGAGGDDISHMLREPMPETQAGGFTAQVVGTGPTVRNSAMSEMFETLIYGARENLFITTPYYAPSAALQAAIRAAANRGIETTIIFPARNDDFAIAATSRSYYRELLEAGVRIYEYQAGLLHSKSLTIDGEITLIGSANMDRRSLDLNYENNILVCDHEFTRAVRARQQDYVGDCREITLAEVVSWGVARQLLQNTLAIVGPLL
ncbi:MAG: cardiolipin synthase [Phenylobacterium sp.]|uniref:cardiolipin synthase n=1 Tax=Phenylobacterium sp. TaxID=1871053 RepID=UPI001A409418|nr:cardiolipin synthase [Phenylobacterium sp.]MBL8555382.1 cardiolipin synthase [Phenylobacterium sp.]